MADDDEGSSCLKRIGIDNEYAYVRKIGQGGFGTVHLIQDKGEAKQCVVKIIDNRSREEMDLARREIDFMKRLQHKNIVRYKKDFEFHGGVIVIMEYCGGGDLGEVIKTRRLLPLEQIVRWLVQICSALKYIHGLKILHRDLKPANIFLTDDRIIKLGDFGVSRQLMDSLDFAKTYLGTPLYISPEIYNQVPYNHKADVWSVGCCIYELMTFEAAFNPMQVYMEKKWNIKEMPRSTYGSDLCDIVQSMLTIDPLQRPSITDILDSPFLQSFKEAVDEEAVPAKPDAPGETVHGDFTPGEIDGALDTTLLELSASTSRKSLENSCESDFERTFVVVEREDVIEHDLTKSSANKDVAHPNQRITDQTAEEVLQELGYKFNEENHLVTIANGERFKYDVFGNKEKNEKHYQSLAKVINDYVGELMEKELNMGRVTLPVDLKTGEPFTFIYATPDFLNNKDKLLILVSGSGPIRAGVWSRKVIINDSIDAGSQIPAVRRAIDEGYAVLVLNQNQTYLLVDGIPFSVRDNFDATHHMTYVWDEIVIKNTKARHVAFLAHSGGGSFVVRLAVDREEYFKQLVFGVALCCTIHDHTLSDAPKTIVEFLRSKSRSWVTSPRPLNENLGKGLFSMKKGIEKFSAGDERPEWTIHSAMDAAFKFLDEKYQQRLS